MVISAASGIYQYSFGKITKEQQRRKVTCSRKRQTKLGYPSEPKNLVWEPFVQSKHISERTTLYFILVSSLHRSGTDLPGALITRWLAWIQLFDFEVCHVPGRKHAAADGLSRPATKPPTSGPLVPKDSTMPGKSTPEGPSAPKDLKDKNTQGLCAPSGSKKLKSDPLSTPDGQGRNYELVSTIARRASHSCARPLENSKVEYIWQRQYEANTSETFPAPVQWLGNSWNR